MIPLPHNIVRTNGGQRCDMLMGPCACGATHTIEPDTDAHRRLLDLLAGWHQYVLKCSENESENGHGSGSAEFFYLVERPALTPSKEQP